MQADCACCAGVLPSRRRCVIGKSVHGRGVGREGQDCSAQTGRRGGRPGRGLDAGAHSPHARSLPYTLLRCALLRCGGRGGRPGRGLHAGADQPVLGGQGGRGDDGARVPDQLPAAGHHHARQQRVRATPVPGEDDPQVHAARLARPGPAHPRRRRAPPASRPPLQGRSQCPIPQFLSGCAASSGCAARTCPSSATARAAAAPPTGPPNPCQVAGQ